MSKIYLSRIIKFIALILPIIICILLMQYYWCFENDFSANVIHDYYNEEENSLDVVLLGASDIYCGYSATYAYDQYGYTSYPYVLNSNPGSLYKYELKEILKTQHPQLILVEIDGFLCKEPEKDDDPDELEDLDRMQDESRLRLFTESIPASFNKLDCILQFDYDDKLSCLFPFFKYHGKWQNLVDLLECYKLKTTDYDEPTLLKGTYTRTFIDDSTQKYDITNDNTTEELLPAVEAYLIDFLEYCHDEQLDNIVFVRFPHKITTIEQYNCFCCVNTVSEILKQYGYTLLNLERNAAEIGLDYTTDFSDPEHLNAYGQLKLTDYLGEMIINEYMVTPKIQTDSNKAHWKKCVTYSDAFFTLAEEYLQSGNDTWMFDSLWFMTVLDDVVNNTL